MGVTTKWFSFSFSVDTFSRGDLICKVSTIWLAPTNRDIYMVWNYHCMCAIKMQRYSRITRWWTTMTLERNRIKWCVLYKINCTRDLHYTLWSILCAGELLSYNERPRGARMSPITSTKHSAIIIHFVSSRRRRRRRAATSTSNLNQSTCVLPLCHFSTNRPQSISLSPTHNIAQKRWTENPHTEKRNMIYYRPEGSNPSSQERDAVNALNCVVHHIITMCI